MLTTLLERAFIDNMGIINSVKRYFNEYVGVIFDMAFR